MTHVTIKTLTRNEQSGKWEVLSESNGYAEVRDADTGKCFTVKVASK